MHMPESHKDYHNRYYIALGIVRRIAIQHMPSKPAPVAVAPPVAPPAAPPVRAVPRITVPPLQAVPELRWVYGTRDGKWHLVGPEDRDYAHGITQARMKQIGIEAAKAEYLSPSLARAAQPVPAAPAPVRPLLYAAPKVLTEPVKVPWPTEKPAAKKFVQKTFLVEERMRRSGGYGYGGNRGYGRGGYA